MNIPKIKRVRKKSSRHSRGLKEGRYLDGESIL